jgi:hypothetical protein
VPGLTGAVDIEWLDPDFHVVAAARQGALGRFGVGFRHFAHRGDNPATRDLFELGPVGPPDASAAFAPTLATLHRKLLLAYVDRDGNSRAFRWDNATLEDTWVAEELMQNIRPRSRIVLASGGWPQNLRGRPAIKDSAPEETFAVAAGDGNLSFIAFSRSLLRMRLQAAGVRMAFSRQPEDPAYPTIGDGREYIDLGPIAEEDPEFAWELPTTTAMGYATWLFPERIHLAMARYIETAADTGERREPGTLPVWLTLDEPGNCVRTPDPGQFYQCSLRSWGATEAGMLAQPRPRLSGFRHEWLHYVYQALALHPDCARDSAPANVCGGAGNPAYRVALISDRAIRDGRDIFAFGRNAPECAWAPRCGTVPVGLGGWSVELPCPRPYTATQLATCEDAPGFFGMHTPNQGCNYDCEGSHPFVYAVLRYLEDGEWFDARSRGPLGRRDGRDILAEKYRWVRAVIFHGAEFADRDTGVRRGAQRGAQVGASVRV